MKIQITQEEDRMLIHCKGKTKSHQEFFAIKQSILSQIQSPEIPLIFAFETFPIELEFLGFLLMLSSHYSIQILISNYSNYRLLEDLYLLEKFNVRYQKDSR